MASTSHKTYTCMIYILSLRPSRRASCPHTETMYEQPCMEKNTLHPRHLKTHSLKNPSASTPLAQQVRGMAPLL